MARGDQLGRQWRIIQTEFFQGPSKTAGVSLKKFEEIILYDRRSYL
jgi:hypothetical protein